MKSNQYTLDNLIDTIEKNLIVDFKRIITKSPNLLDVTNEVTGESLVFLIVRCNKGQFIQCIYEQHPSKLQHKDKQQKNILMFAILCENLDVIDQLLKVKKELISDKDCDGNTPLLFAASTGHTLIFDKIACMLPVQGEINEKNHYGNNALGLAAVSGHLLLARHLVEKYSFKADLQDKHGNTPLHWAAITGRIALLDYFISISSSPFDKINKIGDNCLMSAIRHSQKLLVTHLLDLYNPNVLLKNNTQTAETPLEVSIIVGRLDLCLLLLERKPDLHLQYFSQNKSLLYIAVENKQLEVAEFFLNTHQYNPCDDLLIQKMLEQLSEDVASPQGLNVKGRLLVDLEKYSEAMISINEAIKLCPNYKSAILNKALCLMRQSKCEVALEEIELLDSLDKANSEAKIIRGFVYLNCGNYSEAENIFHEASKLSPNNSNYYCFCSLAALMCCEYERASQLIEKSFIFDHSNPCAQTIQGFITLLHEETKSAQWWFSMSQTTPVLSGNKEIRVLNKLGAELISHYTQNTYNADSKLIIPSICKKSVWYYDLMARCLIVFDNYIYAKMTIKEGLSEAGSSNILINQLESLEKSIKSGEKLKLANDEMKQLSDLQSYLESALKKIEELNENNKDLSKKLDSVCKESEQHQFLLKRAAKEKKESAEEICTLKSNISALKQDINEKNEFIENMRRTVEGKTTFSGSLFSRSFHS